MVISSCRTNISSRSRIRAGRKKPGLLRQHLTSVEAAAAVSQAQVAGAELRSDRLEFRPGKITPGDYHFSVGTAGSACLVLQTILPPLCTAEGPSKLTVEGGTHNPFAPTFHYLKHVYLPRVARMGPRFVANLHQYGFFPAGGGRFTLQIEPVPTLEVIELMNRGKTTARHAAAFVAHVSDRIAERELRLVRKKLGWSDEECEVVRVRNSKGPGNILCLTLSAGDETEVVTAFGEVRLRAEAVAQKAVDQMRRFIRTDVPVGHNRIASTPAIQSAILSA